VKTTQYYTLIFLGIERNIKVWTTDRRCLVTRRGACIITLFIVLFAFIYDHPFLLLPYDTSYCFFKLYNQSILFSCHDAHYHAYGHTFSLTDLLFIENVGLNNFILPIVIILTNVVLIIGLRRRAYQRQHRLNTCRSDDWREQSVILYMLLSSIAFIFLTSPAGILNCWSVVHGERIPTNNLALVLDLVEIIHHCSHFPILLMTSSIIRKKTFQIVFHPRLQRQHSFSLRQSPRRVHSRSLPQDVCPTEVHLPMTDLSSTQLRSPVTNLSSTTS
jgi:hypothetical protein